MLIFFIHFIKLVFNKFCDEFILDSMSVMVGCKNLHLTSFHRKGDNERLYTVWCSTVMR